MTPKDKKDFTARHGDQSNVIRMVRKASDLIGIGTEFLVEGKTVLAKFYGGNLIYGTPVVDADEVTQKAA